MPIIASDSSPKFTPCPPGAHQGVGDCEVAQLVVVARGGQVHPGVPGLQQLEPLAEGAHGCRGDGAAERVGDALEPGLKGGWHLFRDFVKWRSHKA